MLTVFEQLFDIYDEACEKKLMSSMSKTSLDHLTYNHYAYLHAIKELATPTLSTLAEHLEITKPSATVMVNKFIKEDLVEKVQSSEDKRVYNVQLTTLGKMVVNIERESFMDMSKKLLSHLTEDEQEVLKKLLKKGLANV